MYCLFILLSFVVMKVVNFRLHLCLGTDPIPEPEVEGEEGEGEEEENKGNNGEDKEEATGDERTGGDGKTAEESKAAEAAIEIPVTSPDEESLKRHRDSASTLGQSSSLNGGLSQSLELHNVSPESRGAEEVDGRTREEEMEEVREVYWGEGAHSRDCTQTHTLSLTQSSDGVLQPIHEESVPPINVDSTEQ